MLSMASLECTRALDVQVARPASAECSSSRGEMLQLATRTAIAAAIGSSNVQFSLRAEQDPCLQKVLLDAQWLFRQEVDWLARDEDVGSQEEVSSSSSSTVVRSGRPSARQRRLGTRLSSKDKLEASAVCVDKKKKARQRRRKSGGAVEGFLDSYLKHGTSHESISDEEQVLLWDKILAARDLLREKNALQRKLGYEPTNDTLAEALCLSRKQVSVTMWEADAAKKRLILANLRLVVSIAKHYANMGVDLGDLIQEGTFGLAQAVDKFDVNRANKFSTYAYWWIFQAMIRSLDRFGKAVRYPFHVCETVRKINQLKSREGPLSTERLMEELKLPKAKVERALRASSYKLQSSHQRLRNGKDSEEGSFVEEFLVDRNPENQPWAAVEKLEAVEQLKHLLATHLDPREREVISKRFGIDRSSALSRFEIASSCGLSRERVRQLEHSALSKLRSHRSKLNIDFMLQELPSSMQ